MDYDLDSLLGSMPFAVTCGIVLDAAAPDLVTGRMPWSAERSTTGGILHGGSLMTFADSLGAICAFLNLERGFMTSTIESKTNFFRAVSSGFVHGTSVPVHVGRTTIVLQTDVRDDAGKRVALCTQTQAVIPFRKG